VKNKLRVLNTRPDKKGEQLNFQLQQAGIESVHQPMFDYVGTNCQGIIERHLANYSNISLIFVSVAAVEFADQQKTLSTWPNIHKVFAVGDATAAALAQKGIQAFVPNQHNSEGLLALPEMASPMPGPILIVRGDSGRELLSETLNKRNEVVHYIEAYQRKWRQFSDKIPQVWRQSKFNCIVITSEANLKHLLGAVCSDQDYWLEQCTWLVASERIAECALKKGVKKVINLDSARNDAILNCLQHMD
jgi:uroporphyrinogen-III synthase